MDAVFEVLFAFSVVVGACIWIAFLAAVAIIVIDAAGVVLFRGRVNEKTTDKADTASNGVDP